MRVSVHGSRDRVFDRGAGDLDTHELLALLFRGADVDHDALIEVSGRIDAGTTTKLGVDPHDGRVDGLPLEPSVVLAAAMELARRVAELPPPDVIRGPEDAAAIAQRELRGLRRERVLVIVCDALNRPLRTVVVSDGAVDRSMAPVREILSAVLRWDGRAFAIAHNHPRGDPEPSDADLVSTRRVADAARVVGLRFLGHVVVADGEWAAVAT